MLFFYVDVLFFIVVFLLVFVEESMYEYDIKLCIDFNL